MTTFKQSLAIQRRVIGALLMREIITRYGRTNIGFLWLIVEPALFTLGITFLWTYTRDIHGSDLQIVPFALTGYSSLVLWRGMPQRCMNAILPNEQLMYHRYVRLIDIYIARILLEAIGATAAFILLSTIFIFIGWMSPPEDILECVFAWILLGWFGVGFALVVAALSEMTELIEKIWSPISLLMFVLSGAAYSVDALPESAQRIMLYLPMVNGLEMLREGYFGSSYHAHFDTGYLITFNLACTTLGLAGVNYIREKAIVR